MQPVLAVTLNEESLNVLRELTAALKGLGVESLVKTSAATEEKKPAAAKATAKSKAKTYDAEPGPNGEIYWCSTHDGSYGVVDDEAAFDELKKTVPKLVRMSPDSYGAKLVAEQSLAKAEQEAEAKAEQSKPTKKTAEKPAAKNKRADDVPSEQDIVEVFSAYLPVDLDAETKAERRPLIKAMLTRFGAAKATAIAEEHRRLAVNLVQRLIAGEDVDVENDDYQEIVTEEDEDDLV